MKDGSSTSSEFRLIFISFKAMSSKNPQITVTIHNTKQSKACASTKSLMPYAIAWPNVPGAANARGVGANAVQLLSAAPCSLMVQHQHKVQGPRQPSFL